MKSNFVTCATMAEVQQVLAACFAEGFKAIATQNLNGAGYLVEYWGKGKEGEKCAG